MMNKYHLTHIVLLAMMWPVGLIADNYVIINQVMYDSPLNEQVAASPYSNGEFVELYNGSDEAVSLHNWYLYGESWTEHFLFQNISIPAKGYLVVAFRHEDSPLFTLDSLYTLPAGNPNFQIIYQNSVILANAGETIQLRNADWQMMDQITYDGNSHLSKPDRLSADNPDSIPGSQCVSLHRTWVEFDENGLVVQGTSQWKTSEVTFSECKLAETSFGEHSLTGNQSLPTGENYILSVTPLDPTTRVSINNGQIAVSNGVRTRTTIQYIDGLGRVDEIIALGVTPDDKDLVSVTDYHGKRMVARQWCPVVAETEGQRMDITSVQSQAQTDYSDDYPYNETTYENSAIGRPVVQAKPGAAYNGRQATQSYDFNSANEVRIFTVDNSSGALKADGSYYTAYTLYKNTTSDEDGKSVTTYTDKQGRKVMEKRDNSHSYYVYDDLGRLRFMIPNLPASRLTNGTYSLNDSILKAVAYCYMYDARGNMIYKRLPGCEPQRMVFDQIGQLILKQDGNQHLQNKWTLCAYDSVGRNVYIAELPLPQNHDYYLALFENMWYVEYYGDNPAAYSFAGTGYASTVLGKNGLRLLIVNYYDNHDYLKRRLTTEMRQHLRYQQEPGYSLQYDSVVGLLTGTLIYNLSETSYTAKSYFYDSYGHVVQTRSICSNGEYKSATSSEYHFDGSIAQQLTTQGSDSNLVREHYRYTHDRAGRTKQTYYQLNSEDEIILSEYSYDNTGRLVQNLLCNRQDTIHYSYDMRNMLTGTRNRHFTERLFYADSLPQSATACYNGNIAALRIDQMDSVFTFAYTYDACNRLKTSNRLTGYGAMFSESFDYDDAGNILRLKRYIGTQLIDDLVYDYGNIGNQICSISDNGHDADQYSTIEYHNGKTVADTTFRYDANGNLIYDADRGISAIRYNILNLPDTIQFSNGNQIVNLYDAAGRKYRSVTYTLPATAVTPIYEIAHYNFSIDTIHFDVTEYTGNIERRYSRTDTTQRVFNTIGYCQDDTFFYAIKDHLGNTSVMVNATTQLPVQSTVYYASGVQMAQSWGKDQQPYLYNGKEFIEAHGYNTYDYGFRGYYATTGRFTSVDPLAEQTPWQSPYTYANNNPINNIDLMGLSGMNSMTNKNVLQYIVIGPAGEYLGGVNNDDRGIYIDPDGKWKTEDGIDNLELVGHMIMPFLTYEIWIGKGNKAPGFYYGNNYSISVSGSVGWQASVYRFSGFSLPSWELFSISTSFGSYSEGFELGQIEYDYLGNKAEIKTTLGAQSTFGYEYSIKHNVRTEFPNRETMTNTIWIGPVFVNSKGTYGVTFSFALIGGLSISITGELYYEKNE